MSAKTSGDQKVTLEIMTDVITLTAKLDDLFAQVCRSEKDLMPATAFAMAEAMRVNSDKCAAVHGVLQGMGAEVPAKRLAEVTGKRQVPVDKKHSTNVQVWGDSKPEWMTKKGRKA